MAKQIAQDEDRLKRQARRRLIGAVALTTAIVVVLPMVLDNEPKPAGQDIELRIPDKDKVGEFAPKIDLSSASAPAITLPASAPTVAASAPVVAVTPPVPVAPPVKVIPPVAQVVAAPTASVPVAVAPVTSKPAPPPAKTPVPAPKPKPEPKPEPVKHDAKAAPAKHESKAVAHTEQGQPAPQSGFVVQIGAFSNADTAHSWQKNLKLRGFNAYTEKLGDKTRVRIGPYSTHEAASAARRKLEKTQGLHSNIVKLN